jgi:hypothetical protein
MICVHGNRYPGDVINMSVVVREKGLITFTVEGEGKKYQTQFECDGINLCEFEFEFDFEY